MQLILGTDLAKKLRCRGYRGLLLIRSANDSSNDIESYMDEGYVDGCIGKNANGADTAILIQEAYRRKSNDAT